MDWAPTVATGLVLALVFGTIARRLGQSPLLGYLLAGVLIGPHTPGFVGSADLAGQLADVGVILLMFGVGLGFSFQDLWSVRRLAVPGALAASGVVVLLGTGLGLAMSWPLGGALVLGMCLATASTVLIVRGMTDLGMLASAPGRIAVGWSLVEDLITVVLLVVLPAIAPSAAGEAVVAVPLWQALSWSLGKVVLLAGIVVYGGGFVVPRLLALVARAQSRELFTLAVLTFALSVAFVAAEVFGVSVALGAFFAGMVVGRSDLAHQAAADALPMRDAFAVLFFVAVGMLFDPLYVVDHPLTVVAALSFVLVGKPLVAVALMLRRGQSLKTALSVGAGLAQVSEFSFLLAGLATSLSILPEGGRDLVVAVALSSIAASPMLFRMVVPIERWLLRHPRLGQWFASSAKEVLDPASAGGGALGQHVVICGFGRVGSVLGEFLTARLVPFVVIEMDRTLAENLRARGVNVLWGDAGSPTLLDRAGIERARAVVLTTPDSVTQRLALEHVRSVRPDVEVLVRAHSTAQLHELAQLPKTRAVNAERELGFAMARELLEALGASRIEAEVTVLSAERRPAGMGTAPRLFEIEVRATAAVVGQTLAEIGLPSSALVVAVVRGGVHLVARGPTRLEQGDVVIVFATGEDSQSVERVLTVGAG